MKLSAYLYFLFAGKQSHVTLSAPYLKNGCAVSLSTGQRAALLLGLIHGEAKGTYSDSLQTGLTPAELRECLDVNPLNWQIEGTQSAHGVLDFLLNEGERTAYEVLRPLLLTLSGKQALERYIRENFCFTDLALYYAGNLSDNVGILQESNVFSVTATDLQKGILAWDMAMVVFIARLSFDAGYLTEHEAWGYIEAAYHRCKTKYFSWHEVAISYLIGEAMHTDNPQTFFCITQKACAALTDPGSPWQEIPLNL